MNNMADKCNSVSKPNSEAPAYTYEQMATLNLQLQGLIDAENEAFFKLREECEYYKNQLKLIRKVLNNEI